MDSDNNISASSHSVCLTNAPAPLDQQLNAQISQNAQEGFQFHFSFFLTVFMAFKLKTCLRVF